MRSSFGEKPRIQIQCSPFCDFLRLPASLRAKKHILNKVGTVSGEQANPGGCVAKALSVFEVGHNKDTTGRVKGQDAAFSKKIFISGKTANIVPNSRHNPKIRRKTPENRLGFSSKCNFVAPKK